MKNICAGIDFGTTNTTAAVYTGGSAPRIIPLENEHQTIPSAIFLPESGGGTFFGRDAMRWYLDGEPGRILRSLKRVLGTDLMKNGTVIAERRLDFRAIIGEFIRHVKNKLDAAAISDVTDVVMGRPVHFRDNDAAGDAAAENELREIAINAGFHNVLFQYEPIAAAFAHERNLTSETLAAVIDIGGGTSDFSVIRLGGARMARPDRRDDILANTGVRIGGNDFDKQLSLKTFMPEFGMGTEYGIDKILPIPAAMFFDLSEWSQVNSIYTYKNMDLADMYLATAQCPEKYSRFAEVQKRQQGHRVLSTVEDTKIELTARPHISVPLDFLSRAPEIRATRNEFEMGIEPLTNKILDSVRECVKMSGVRPGDIGLVILTGGSTEIPYIRENFCRLFPNARISADDKLSSVGLGLAYDAMRRFG